jgi:hypothetical protein
MREQADDFAESQFDAATAASREDDAQQRSATRAPPVTAQGQATNALGPVGGANARCNGRP